MIGDRKYSDKNYEYIVKVHGYEVDTPIGIDLIIENRKDGNNNA